MKRLKTRLDRWISYKASKVNRQLRKMRKAGASYQMVLAFSAEKMKDITYELRESKLRALSSNKATWSKE